jgi:hypothetical protein
MAVKCVGGCGKRLRPVGSKNVVVKKEHANAVIESAKDTLCSAILL